MLSSAKAKLALVEALEEGAGIPTDVTILVDGGKAGMKEFHAHKYYLALVSEVVRTKFFDPLEDRKDILEVIGVPAPAVAAMINFIYHRDCGWDTMSVEEVFEVAKVAEIYDVTGLMNQVKYVISKIKVNLANVVYLAHTAGQFSIFKDVSQTLLDSCISFLCVTLEDLVLDFSGLAFSPQHEDTLLRLFTLTMERPPELPRGLRITEEYCEWPDCRCCSLDGFDDLYD